jgi:hypothetical protein
MMTNVEQHNAKMNVYPGFHWAQPRTGKTFDVSQIGQVLEISGFYPRYRRPQVRSDLIQQYEKFAETLAKSGQISGARSPEVSFANADTDEKLIAFVRQFGPVVATQVWDTRNVVNPRRQRPSLFGRLVALQDLEELRNEQAVYRAALGLVNWLATGDDDIQSIEPLFEPIISGIRDWPRQWEREMRLRRAEPAWRLRESSLERIREVGLLKHRPGWQAALDVRIIICGLLNSFPSTVYPNPIEMHASIKFGIRPLLYSILRRHFLYPRGISFCLNTECRNFFNIERAGQRFCNAECSRRQRQRDYWTKNGKKMRKKRTSRLRAVSADSVARG